MLGLILFIVIVNLVSNIRIFQKAGQPGFAALIPIYNLIVFFKIVNISVWAIFLLLIPGVNVIMMIWMNIRLAEEFNKSLLFGIGLTLLPFITTPILAFGSAEYFASSSETSFEKPKDYDKVPRIVKDEKVIKKCSYCFRENDVTNTHCSLCGKQL